MKTTIKLPGSKLYAHEIEIEPFTVADISKLTRIQETEGPNGNYELLKLLDSKLNVDITTIYENDLTFIMWWLRFNTFTSTPKVIRYKCPHCLGDTQKSLSSADLEIVPPRDEYTKDGIDIALSEQRTVRMKLLTMGEILEVDKYIRDILEDKSADTRKMLLIIQQIEPGLDIHTKYNKYVIDDTRLTPDEFYVATAFSSMYEYGVKESIVTQCELCEGQVRLPMEVSLLDFFPTLYDARDLYSRVRSS